MFIFIHMKVSYFAIGLILIGALIFGAAYAGHPLTIVTIGNSYSDSIPLAVAMPSGTSSSSPTTFATNGYEVVSATWIGTITQISDISTSGSGSAYVQISDSSGYSVTKPMTNSWTLKYVENPLTHAYSEVFTADASYNFTNPYPTQAVVYTFTFSGSATYGSGMFNFVTSTTYGEFPLQSVQHLGHFYFQLSNITPVQIANTATALYYNVSGTSTTFQIWYVEDNGTTIPFTDAYMIYLFGTTQVQVTLSTQTTLDGYTAFTTSPVTIPVPTTLYLQGYVVANGAQGSPYEIMDFASNTSGPAPTPTFSLAQYEWMAIGGALMIIGAVWIFKK